MKVLDLEIASFRNLQQIAITPCDTVNIISGNNAQGKTNLLETIWLFTGAKSFRATRERDFSPPGSTTTTLKMHFYAANRPQEAEISWSGEKRQILLNGVKKENPGALHGVFSGVLFSPDHMMLIKNGPEHRRQMLDISLSQAYPKYAEVLTSYQKALRQRGSLLRDIQMQPSMVTLLDIWDEYIAYYGGYICTLRQRYIRKLEEYARPYYNGISRGMEEFSLNYITPYLPKDTTHYELEDYRVAIARQLEARKQDDIRLKSTTIGPHRDDLEILINELSARQFGSQGQQRSCILAMKLAECNILEEQLGESPIVMLDDVMSELDSHRREYLLNRLGDKQVFITCCDPELFEHVKHGSLFIMKQGKLEKDQNKVVCNL